MICYGFSTEIQCTFLFLENKTVIYVKGHLRTEQSLDRRRKVLDIKAEGFFPHDDLSGIVVISHFGFKGYLNGLFQKKFTPPRLMGFWNSHGRGVKDSGNPGGKGG